MPVAGWSCDRGVYLIAEIGGNHEGDFDTAVRLTELACASGVDAVKFQIYTGDTLVSEVETPDRHAHFKRFELTPDQYVSLAHQCADRGVIFVASVWDTSALDWIDPYIPFYKIGSGDLTAFPLLKQIARLGKPMMLSTGLATLDEIREPVDYLRSIDARYEEREYLSLLQCTSMYPIPDEEANLSVIPLLREEFGTTVGYSDHTVGSEAAEVAVAMGAEVLELHFTDTREGKKFRDHKVSFTVEEIQSLIGRIARTKTLLGSPVKKPTQSEIDSHHTVTFRRAVYPSRDLPKGTVLAADDLTVLRPNHGIDARSYDEVLGRRLSRSVKRHERLEWAYLD